ncbi:MAG: hypothetical protein KDA53_13510 [Hyphomonas sp.]|nr:hypothetical protein [Hyphomonas sp.]
MSQPAPAPENSGQPQIIPHIAALASQELQAELATVCSEVSDLAGLGPAEVVMQHGGGIVLLEQSQAGWDQLLLKIAVDRPSTAVIVLSDQIPSHMVRALMKLDMSDILPASASVGEIQEAASKFSDAVEKGVSGGASICWAFRGAVGGAGVSTLALETSFELAKRVGEGKVCLVDLNLADGMITSFVEAVPKLDLVALSAAPERLDPRLLAAWCSRHDSGVSIIAAPRNPDADALGSEAAILRLLDVACSVFEYVIVDMPRHMMPWTKSVLAAVDEAIVISELTVPSLHAAADMCRETDVLRRERTPARLVLNRMFQKKRLRAEFPVDQAEKAIERKINQTITSDWDAARTAVNVGRPIAEVKPKSPLVADVVQMVSDMLPEHMRAAQPERGRRRGRA